MKPEWHHIIVRFALSSGVRRTLKVLLTLGLLLLVGGYGFLEYTNQPRFCVTCHYMRPFYEAWKTSSHKQVPCVECHYPPGLKPGLQRKFRAVVQVAKYATKQYGTRPWTEIEDASCLRRGCHETRLLKGRVKFGGVVFDHAPHLTSFRRVTRLRCTSCHAQIVQGTHMTVTSGSCFLCHFKNPEEEPHLADCQLCHHQPLEAEQVKAKFDHRFIAGRTVSCTECHADVVYGKGPVPRERCYVCHSEPERIAQYHHTEFMHLNHVTEHKVDCMRCHLEIQHKLPPVLKEPRLDCQSCHPHQHGAEANLYAGTGGQGVKEKPNPMFLTRVPCGGCHLTHEKVEGKEVNLRAGAAGCMNCHGEKYGQTLAHWKAKAALWLSWMETVLAKVKRELREARRPEEPQGEGEKEPLKQAQTLYQSAAANFALVRRGRAVHNMDYAQALLQAASARLNEALALVGSRYRVPPPPTAPKGVQQSKCTGCHSNIAAQTTKIFGLTFAHASHLLRAKLSCAQCHSASLKPQEAEHGQTRLSPEDCRRCHQQQRPSSPHPTGWRMAHGLTARRENRSCLLCHPQSTCNRCHGMTMPHPPDWAQGHTQVARGNRPLCSRCHTPGDCWDCHRIEMPHPPNWKGQPHHWAARQRPTLCAQCHRESFCFNCHGTEVPHPPGWKQKHGPPAEEQPAVCARCHRQKAECLACHQKRPPPSHGALWRSQHGDKVKTEEPTCQLCHGTCQDCHQTPMPHPSGWMLEKHGAEAAGEGKAKCRYCHEASYCQKCH